jgi:hypothetical protein
VPKFVAPFIFCTGGTIFAIHATIFASVLGITVIPTTLQKYIGCPLINLLQMFPYLRCFQ